MTGQLPAAADSDRSRGPRLNASAAGRCRRRIHLDHDPDADRTARVPMDSSSILRLDERDTHRDNVLARFRSPTSGWTPDSAERPELLIRQPLRSITRFGTPDVLIWVGDGYLPILIRGHRTLDPGAGAWVSSIDTPLDRRISRAHRLRSHTSDQLALAHFHRLLADLNLGSTAAIGGVIGRGNADGDGYIGWLRLDGSDTSVLTDYDLRFADRLAVATAAETRSEPLALPSRISECRRCPWDALCSRQMQEIRDVSLVASGSDGLLLKESGIDTVDKLANSDAEVLAELPLTGPAVGQLRLRARAWQRQVSLVRQRDVPVVPRADIELDIDMESFMEDGAYLWGTYLSGSEAGRAALESVGKVLGYQPFVSWEPLPSADEGRAFAEFWGYLRSLRTLARDRGLTFVGYCYSRAAEERWLRSTPLRYPEVLGMPAPAEVAEFINSAEWVDMYAVVGAEFVVPGSRKLKEIAKVAGFSWRDAEPGGANSMVWYSLAVAPEPDLDMRTRVLEYNEDDVIATYELRKWIDDRSVAETMTVADLERAPAIWE